MDPLNMCFLLKMGISHCYVSLPVGIYFSPIRRQKSGDSWMYPYQRNPMGNPYISPICPYIVGVYGLLSPRIPIFSPYKYHGSTRTLGVHPSLSLEKKSSSPVHRLFASKKVVGFSDLHRGDLL